MDIRSLPQQSSSIKREEEQILVDRCRRGDMEAFTLLMRRHEKRIYNYTYRMLGNAEDAEDLTQDIFIAVYKGIRGFRAEARFSTWLYRIALNQTRNRLKYLSRRAFFSGRTRMADTDQSDALDTPEGLADGAPSPEQWTLARDLASQVQRCLNQLPHQARQILVLRDVQGFSYEELGEMLSLNPGTVKSRLHRARSALQQCLADEVD